MKRYLADTNLYLRFILQDNKRQAGKTEEYLEAARKEKIGIIFHSEVILEMEFVLRSVYSLERLEIAKYLSNLVNTSYLEIKDRNVWADVLEVYVRSKVSLLDIFLFFKAKRENVEVLSFDKDFKKLKRMKLD